MDIDRDPGLLDPEQFPSELKTSPKLEELYNQWLSLPGTGQLVTSLINNQLLGTPVSAVGNPSIADAAGSSKSSLLPAGSSSVSSFSFREPMQEDIPQFYFPNGPPPPEGFKEHCLARIHHYFLNDLGGLQLNDVRWVKFTREICNIPSFFAPVLFRKIAVDDTGTISRDAFFKYWVDSNMVAMDTATQIFRILKHPDRNYLTQDDFVPILQHLLATHVGLQLLQDNPQFQERYMETVIYRIFYCNSRYGDGRLTLRDLKRGNIIAALRQVEDAQNINEAFRYFSYEQFYVVFCHFWELDTDGDSHIDGVDLLRYEGGALTGRIINRIFTQVPRRFISAVAGKMSYKDFLHFMWSEVDKSSDPSLEFWFKCIDVDGNGVITPNEIGYFYEEQIHRLSYFGEAPTSFDNMIRKIVDMIAPRSGDCNITLGDIKRSKLSGEVFDILTNTPKLKAASEDARVNHRVGEDPRLTDWELFARREYVRIMLGDIGDGSDDESSSDDEELVDASPQEAPF